MDDLELLMMAAKAIGRKVKRIDGDSRTLCGIFFEDHDPDDYSWNPLTDDGDALRLVVKCGLEVYEGSSDGVMQAWCGWSIPFRRTRYIGEPHGVDAFAATRRAIVRAAAEIGKAIGNG